jgi:hypothetical protein
VADNSADDAGETGPIEPIVREKVKELDSIRELLREARQEKAAGRIEELQTEVARRIGELKKIVADGGR